jgi:hypothetical protein
MSSGNEEWLRSGVTRGLILAALIVSLTLGTAFLVITTPRPAGPGALGGAAPLTNDQATAQVLGEAKQVVDAAKLDRVSGTSVFLSCTSLHDPPYQAAIYLNFALPEQDSVKRIREIATAMLSDGWQQAPSMGEHFGAKLTKNGMTSTFHQNPDDPHFGAMRIYGECRVTSDHRNDNPAFTDITDRLG